MTSESSSNFDDFKDLEALLDLDRERELNIYRSGSAPPTVEGSRTAIRSLLGHNNGESFLSNPDYLSYYYSNDTLKNPRMPPPLVSREDWRVVERFSNGNSVIGDRRKKGLENGDGNSLNSLFSVQPGLKEEEWRNDGLIGLGCRRKSFKDVLQEDGVPLPPVSPHPSRPVSSNAYGISNDLKEPSDVQFAQVHNDMNAVGGLRPGTVSPGLVRVQSFGSGTISPGLVRVQNLGSTMSQSFASAVGSSSSRSTTPDPHVIGMSSRHGPHLSERMINAEKRLVSNGFGAAAAHVEDIGDVVDALSNLNISDNIKGDGESHVQGQLHHQFTVQTEGLYNAHNDHNKYSWQKIMINPDSESLNVSSLPLLVHNGFSKNTGIKDFGVSALASNGNLSNKVTAMGSESLGEFSGRYLKQMANVDFVGHDSNAFQTLPAILNNHLNEGGDVSSGSGGQYLSRSGNRIESSFQAPVVDPLYAQYLQRASDYTTDLSDRALLRNYLSTNPMDMSGYNKAYLGALLAQQRLPQGTTYLGKPGDLNNGFYGNSGGGLHVPFPTLIPGNSVRQNDPLSRFSSTLRSGAYKGSWNNVNGIMDQGFALTLLEEFKANKTRSFELSEIADHVVEFSGDQYGSRFIQQKLETASVEEKNKLFPEILSHARVLMTDVFGNYVIQKFFEHGTESQRNQLAGQLMGHVLSLSLQMYGCRVIQKALEVVDVEQQTRMVSELDGSIMKCVRDQNGNHVIQKCIECVPEERIQFIVSSFYGQVVALSTHPYGCRVIQRVLEHCKDVKTQSIMMDEIMRSVCILAQDQYGNYVIQHVLQHGKQEERAVIISKLAGQIVKMSQQKFASNVVEKCLTFGSPAERQLLIDEMLGSTDENEPLQAMMKDQFGNYVVQKVLETCDDQNRELILSRVRVHLNASKRKAHRDAITCDVRRVHNLSSAFLHGQ